MCFDGSIEIRIADQSSWIFRGKFKNLLKINFRFLLQPGSFSGHDLLQQVHLFNIQFPTEKTTGQRMLHKLSGKALLDKLLLIGIRIHATDK